MLYGDTDRDTDTHTDTQTHRHTDTQTHRHTDTHTHINLHLSLPSLAHVRFVFGVVSVLMLRQI